MNQLESNFLIDLAKACIISPDILGVVKKHMSYNFINGEPYKIIYKYLFDYHSANNKSPSIGLISQNAEGKGVLEIVGKIREANVFDNKDKLLETLEWHIKKSRFVKLHKEAEELYNQQKHDEAIKLSAFESDAINKFSLKRQLHSRIFTDFDARQIERQKKDFTLKKIPTGIPALDHHTRGGYDRGTGILGIARSGVGKTTFLRSLGGTAAFKGINVLHFAAGDSTQEEVEDGYDSWWTGIDMFNMREGNLDGGDRKKIEKFRQAYMAQCGEIYVHVFKGFNSASILDCRDIFIELSKEVEIGLVLFDYLEKFEPGDGKKYGTTTESDGKKKLATAEKIISVATEFNIGVGTVTQASEVPKEIWNDSNKVLTRSNISTLKATIDPFAYCVTLNQTDDENDKDIMRIHEEKIRHYKKLSWESTYPIMQRRETGRFIDLAETKKRFWDDEAKKVIRNTVKS